MLVCIPHFKYLYEIQNNYKLNQLLVSQQYYKWLQVLPSSCRTKKHNYLSKSFYVYLIEFFLKYSWQYYVSFKCTTSWFDICIHYEMITMVSLVTICPHKKLLQFYWPYSLCCILHLSTYLLYNWKSVPFNPLHLFYPHAPPFWQPPICSLYLWICFCSVLFVLFFRFHI